MRRDYERHRDEESCARAKREFTHVGLLRWWKWEASTPWICDRTPWKREPLFINLLLTSQRWDDVRCRGAVCFISLQSPLPTSPHHNPPHFFFFFLLFSLFHFKCEVKVCVNICRASPPWRENKSLDSCLYVWFFILSLAFLSLSFERNVSQGLCTRRISLFWQSKVESNVCNELFSRSLRLFFLSLSAALYFFERPFFLCLDRDSSLPIWCRLDGQG